MHMHVTFNKHVLTAYRRITSYSHLVGYTLSSEHLYEDTLSEDINN